MKILGVDPSLKATGYGLIEVNKFSSGTVAKWPDARHRRVTAEASFLDAAQANEEIAPQVGVLRQSPSRQVKLLEVGTIEPRSKDSLPNKISKIYRHLDDIIAQYAPDVMVLEKLYAHYKHPTTACILGHARGVMCLLCAQRKVKLVEHSVKRIRKALLGNGNASKEQARDVVAHILKFDPGQVTLDASDALALALGYAHLDRY